MMKSCDVLIVGGGPSGSSLAWRLRDSGMDVMLIDKKAFPRDKVCAGWITPPIIEALQLDLGDYSREHVLQPISGFNVRRIGNKENRIRYSDGPVSYGIRRCEFDHYLLDRCGISPVTDTPVRTLERRQGYWLVNDVIKTPMLVGAGGHFCPVARYLGANPGLSELAVAAQEIEFRMNPEQLAACNVEGQIPELYFCEDLKGYGWIFRKGEYLNIGLGREDQHGLSRHVAEFCRYLETLGKLPPAVSEKFKGHAYLLY
ncbi:MAG: FAD-dependent oxidoreductase, partial [Gammaproteobacteria bacterium]